MASGPRDMQGGRRRISVSLQHHNSTKQLISRFESISSSTRPQSSIIHSSHKHKSKHMHQSTGRSPIRESFRNLFSVFKKGARAASADYKMTGTLVGRKSKGLDGSTASFDDSLLHPPPMTVPLASTALHSSDFYHLSRALPPSSPRLDIHPVWIACSAGLNSNYIRITCSSDQGPMSSTEVIPLATCIDVRSSAFGELSLDEKALLPSGFESQGYRIFELVFEGTSRQKLAAPSVHERARWVSAIWDVVISNQESKRGRSNDQDSAGVQEQYSPSPQSSHEPRNSRLSSNYDRKLPAIPPETPAIAQILSPPSIYPASTLPSAPVSESDEPHKTSPVTNPSRLSVVQQRVAEMERSPYSSQSRLSTPPPMSRFSGSGSSFAVPKGIDSETPLTSAEGGGSSPTTATNPECIDSIIDSYNRVVTTEQELPPSTEQSNLVKYALKDGPSVIEGLPPSQLLAVDFTQPPTALSHHQHIGQHSELLSEIHRDILNIVPHVTSLLEGQDHTPQLNALHEMLFNLGHQTQGSQAEMETLRNMLVQLNDNTNRMSDDVVVMRNIGPGSNEGGQTSTTDFVQLNAKLDDLSSVMTTRFKSVLPPAAQPQPADDQETANQLVEQLKAVSSRLETHESGRALQATQQADTVRYLNELNSWLESFVNNGTSQINAVAANLDHLSKQLGICHPQEAQNDNASQDSNQPPQPPKPSNLLADVRQALVNVETQGREAGVLHSSVTALLLYLNEHLQSLASKSEFTPESVMELINRQRSDQEGLLRVLTKELSSEIRGERLRFVEAMKEATAINVQIHVEQFKKELTKEVISMTKEVGRLHQEKQTVEAQIAELFTFYQKQKTSLEESNAVGAGAGSDQAQMQMQMQYYHQQQPHEGHYPGAYVTYPQLQPQQQSLPMPAHMGGAPPTRTQSIQSSHHQRPLPAPHRRR